MRLAADRRGLVVAALGTTQTVAWASSYYVPAVLADPMAQDLALSPAWVFGAFSGALVISALVGPFAGRHIDRAGGRGLLAVSNLVFAFGLALLASATGLAGLLAGWAVLGLGMGIGLYEAAFSTLTAVYRRTARSPITGITLIAGFASTVGWPLSGVMEAAIGWRGACLGWAALHLVLALPLNLLLPGPAVAGAAVPVTTGTDASADGAPPPRHAFALLAFIFATVLFTSTAMAAHLPRLLEQAGATNAAAIAAGALIGPAQVAARLAEFGLMRRVHPLGVTRLALAAHPLAAAVLALVGSPAAAAFALLHGAGNGVLTVARGTLPLALFGPDGYGQRQGLLAAPGRLAQAGAPLLFGLALERFGFAALWLTVVPALLALLAALWLRTGGKA